MTIENDIQPDLTTNNKGGYLIPNGKQRYKNDGDMASSRNIPVEVIRLAKQKVAVPDWAAILGRQTNGIWNWERAQQYFTTNYSTLLAQVGTTKETLGKNLDKSDSDYWELRKLKADTIKAERANLKTDSKYMERQLAINTVKHISIIVSQILKSRLEQELPMKCAGMGALELKEVFSKLLLEIMDKFKQPIQEWEQKEDIKDEETNQLDGSIPEELTDTE